MANRFERPLGAIASYPCESALPAGSNTLCSDEDARSEVGVGNLDVTCEQVRRDIARSVGCRHALPMFVVDLNQNLSGADVASDKRR